MTSPRGLDHLVVPVRDLEAAGAHYAAMGFQVGARNRHPWGTENRLVQFPGAFLELITLGEGAAIGPAAPGTFGFAPFVRDFLARHGDGMSMLVLESTDARADKAAFDAAGIGGFSTFFFERKGRRPTGEEVRVAFSLAYAATPALPDAGFFVCQQHEPQNFWDPALQVHPNGAAGLCGVVLLADDLRAPLAFLEAFSGASAACIGERNIAIVTPRGSIEAMTPACWRDTLGIEAPADGVGRLAAFKVKAPLAPLAERLAAAGIAFTRHRRHLAVAAADNFGTVLVFEEPKVPGKAAR